MKKTKPFLILMYSTYTPLWLLGIIVVFGLLGKLFHIGWLESAPDVLMIPMLVCYYVSLIMGVIYGYLKGQDTVYLMAGISIAAWIVGMLISAFTSLSQELMYVINSVFLAGFLVLHILQYIATKKWEARVISANRE